MKNAICDVCENKETYVKNYKHKYIIKGKNIEFNADRRFCSKCNNLVYDSVLDNNASLLAIKIYNENYGIEKEKIINLRKKYNLSQELFSKVIGCAKKTLISYEKGASIPNDIYLIVLKSLIANPETISTMIKANKEQFTENEYEKISNKVSSFLSNNTIQLIMGEDYKPSEFNGYTNFNKKKIYNMILYFSEESILKTKLLKEMFYADFLFYKNNCKSITGLEYSKLPHGPVPDQFEYILNSCVCNNIITCEQKFYKEYDIYKYSAKNKININEFTNEELEVLKKVKEKFKTYKVPEIEEYSHKEKAFLNTTLGSKISYEYAFDLQI